MLCSLHLQANPKLLNEKELLKAYIQEEQSDVHSPKKWEQLKGILALDRIYHFEPMQKRSLNQQKTKNIIPIKSWLHFEKTMREDRLIGRDLNQLHFMKGAYFLAGKHLHIRDDFKLEKPFTVDLGTGIWSQYLGGNQSQNSMIFYFKLDQKQKIKIQLSYRGTVAGFIDQHYLSPLEKKEKLFLDAGGWLVDLDAGIHRIIIHLDGPQAEFLMRLTDINDQPLVYQLLSRANQQGQMPSFEDLEQLYLSQNLSDITEVKTISMLEQIIQELNRDLNEKELLGIAMLCDRLGLKEQELTQLFYKIDLLWQKKKSFDLWEAMLFVSQKDLGAFPYKIDEIKPKNEAEVLRFILDIQILIKDHLYLGRFEEAKKLIDMIQNEYTNQVFLIEQELALWDELNLKQQGKLYLWEAYQEKKKQGFDWVYLKKLYFYTLLRLGLYNEANDLYSELLAAREDDFELQFAIFSHWTKYQVQEGIELLKRLITQNERTWIVYSEIAELSYKHRLYDQLFAISFPIMDHPDILMLKAKASMILGRFEQGRLFLVQLLLQKPEDQLATELLSQIEPQNQKQLVPSIETLNMLKTQSKAWLSEQQGSAIYLLDQRILGIDDQGREWQRVRQIIEITDAQKKHPLSVQYMIYHPSRERLRVHQAKRYRAKEQNHAILFDQHEISDNDARMYYDLVAKGADFGVLQKGDLLELDYEISRLQPNPTFNTYFSELLIWQNQYPKLYSQVQITPALSSRLKINAQNLDQQNIKEIKTEDGSRQWVALELTAIQPEFLQPMPPKPYLAMGNFQDWTTLAQSYQSLIKPLLNDDALIKEEIQSWGNTIKIPQWQSQSKISQEDWVKKKTIEEKLRLIYDKITQHLRYVGLEFGHHSYEPAVPADTWRRGFGDCKDRAILMILMAKIMGIQLDFVMIRTNSRVPLSIQEQIAGLNFFNHAIVYSPDLDLFLDPTALEFDPFVLPFEDLWGQVLVIDSQNPIQKAELKQVEQNTTKHLKLSLKVNPENELEIHGYFHGENAAFNRKLFQESNANSSFLTHYLLPNELISLEHGNQLMDLDLEESLNETLAEESIQKQQKRDPFLTKIKVKIPQNFDMLFWLKSLNLFDRYAPVTPRKEKWRQTAIWLEYLFSLPCDSPLISKNPFTLAQFQKSTFSKPAIQEYKGFFSQLSLQYQKTENEAQCLFAFSFKINSANMNNEQVSSFKNELNQAQQFLNQSFQSSMGYVK